MANPTIPAGQQITGYASNGQPIYSNIVVPTNPALITPYQSAGSYSNPQQQGGVPVPQIPAVINSSNLQAQPFALPPPPQDSTNYNGLVSGGSATVNSHNETLTPQAPAEGDLLTQLKGLMPPSSSDQYNADYAASGIAGLKSNLNVDQGAVLAARGKLDAVNAKLAGLEAEAKAASLTAEQRGGVEQFARGEQVAIARTAAIKALPIQTEALAAQASVAAAQGNAQLSQSILQQAEEHLDRVYQIHREDAQKQFEYKVSLIEKVYDTATKAQQQKLDERKAMLSSNNGQYNAFINDVRQIAATATSNGQATLATKITNLISTLDPNKSTYTEDFAKINTQLAGLQEQIQAKAPAATVNDKNTAAAGQLNTQLLAARGTDGYTDPNLYARLRSSSSLSSSEFDNRFGYLVNPLSKDRLGLGAATTAPKNLNADQLSIVNDAKSRLDYAKQNYEDTPSIRAAIIQQSIQQYGFDPSPYL